MSFLKKVSTNVARAKQVAMAKMGQTESTVDAQFDQLESQFKDQYSKMKKLHKYVQNYQSAIADLGNAQQGMASMIAEQYEPTDQMFTVSSRLKEEASVRIEQYRDTMEKYYTENFYMPLERYLVQYKILEERITQRNTRLVDMDRYNSEVKALMSKQDTVPTRLQVAKEKAESKRLEYTSLNSELIHDIQAIIADRSRFFDALFANLVQGQTEYLSNSAQSLMSVEQSFPEFNRAAVRTWPRVITDPAQSAFRGASALDVGSDVPGNSGGQPAIMNTPQPQASGFNPNMPPSTGGISLQKSNVVTAVALYPFQGQDASELTFQYNDEIIVHRQGGEWWEGELNGKRGLFPSNYVKLV